MIKNGCSTDLSAFVITLILPLQEYCKKYTEPYIKLLQNYHAHLLSQMFKGFSTLPKSY